MSSKLILIILSYTVSKLVHFLRHSALSSNHNLLFLHKISNILEKVICCQEEEETALHLLGRCSHCQLL